MGDAAGQRFDSQVRDRRRRIRAKTPPVLGSPPIAYHGLERHHAADHLQRPDFLRVRLTHVDGHRRSFFPTDQIDHLPDAHAVGLDTVHGDDQVVALHAGLVGWTGAKGEADLREFFLVVESDFLEGRTDSGLEL